MAMNINSTTAAYGYHRSYNTRKTNEKKETASSVGASIGEKGLSASAQMMLKRLRESKSDMDFFVADFQNGDNAKDILAKSDKEFTVIFSKEEMEKMASNPKYYQEKMRSIDGALRMSEEINAQFGFERAFGKTDGTENNIAGDFGITKFGTCFHSDGSTTFFAQLEKSSAGQKEYLEKLQEQIRSLGWDFVKVEEETVGSRFDFSV